MEQKKILRNQQGFTLIEIIAVLVLLGILAAVAVPKYLDMTTEAKKKAIDAAVAEMNSRENMVWGKEMLSGYSDDTKTWSSVDTSLGSDYAWDTGDPTAAGGGISFQSGDVVELTRSASTNTSPGSWTR